jgi:hypothetical protein
MVVAIPLHKKKINLDNLTNINLPLAELFYKVQRAMQSDEFFQYIQVDQQIHHMLDRIQVLQMVKNSSQKSSLFLYINL